MVKNTDYVAVFIAYSVVIAIVDSAVTGGYSVGSGMGMLLTVVVVA